MENPRTSQRITTAADRGLFGCPSCGRVHAAPVPKRCDRCKRALRADRSDPSLQKVWAWWLVGLMAYIPANLYPMLLTSSLGHTYESTIIGGVIELIQGGTYAVAGIVFLASVAIPISKFFAIAYLAISLQRHDQMRVGARFHLYEIVEFIGRWSMIDVFVVAILATLVQLDFAATINPGIAAICFALSVAFTMLSALSFNPKRIWANGAPQTQ
ncbi:paraquat-inducible protein A [Tropicimonas sp. S265A]|uniref:paraquat-inducible protein A n=1 Tax=Tropicimonas sp. S265A TaxID=3415134 RepID=UPI003C7CBF73